jgi:hypothetical protein
VCGGRVTKKGEKEGVIKAKHTLKLRKRSQDGGNKVV